MIPSQPIQQQQKESTKSKTTKPLLNIMNNNSASKQFENNATEKHDINNKSSNRIGSIKENCINLNNFCHSSTQNQPKQLHNSSTKTNYFPTTTSLSSQQHNHFTELHNPLDDRINNNNNLKPKETLKRIFAFRFKKLFIVMVGIFCLFLISYIISKRKDSIDQFLLDRSHHHHNYLHHMNNSNYNLNNESTSTTPYKEYHSNLLLRNQNTEEANNNTGSSIKTMLNLGPEPVAKEIAEEEKNKNLLINSQPVPYNSNKKNLLHNLNSLNFLTNNNNSNNNNNNNNLLGSLSREEEGTNYFREKRHSQKYLFFEQEGDTQELLRMLDKCIMFIDRQMDIILSLESRQEQNAAFKAMVIPSHLPLKPLRMTGTTAVFKYYVNSNKSNVVILKRVIWNKKTQLYEDETCYKLNSLSDNHNIVKMYYSRTTVRTAVINDTYEEQMIIWMFFEYLDVKISERTPKGNERGIAMILEGSLLGLKVLHDEGYAHLDYKIPNVMGKVIKETGEVLIKLIDFGYTQHIPVMKVIPNKNYGTFPFKPPEVMFESRHGKESDIWSLGLSAYYLADGNIAFYDDDNKKEYAEYKKFAGYDLVKKGGGTESDVVNRSDRNNFGLRRSSRQVVSDDRSDLLRFPRGTSSELKDFIRSCLKVNPKSRPTVDELLNHPFITNYSKMSIPFTIDDLNGREHTLYHHHNNHGNIRRGMSEQILKSYQYSDGRGENIKTNRYSRRSAPSLYPEYKGVMDNASASSGSSKYYGSKDKSTSTTSSTSSSSSFSNSGSYSSNTNSNDAQDKNDYSSRYEETKTAQITETTDLNSADFVYKGGRGRKKNNTAEYQGRKGSINKKRSDNNSNFRKHGSI